MCAIVRIPYFAAASRHAGQLPVLDPLAYRVFGESAILFFKTAGFNRSAICNVLKGKIAWVQNWVQLKLEKWLRFSCKRHQIGHLDYFLLRLLTEGLRVRVLPEYSDDEKPHGADDDFASKSLGKAGVNP